MIDRGWKRPDLQKALSRVTGEKWPDHKVRILDQSKPGVRSHITVDELLILCRAFGCSAYELLLIDRTDAAVTRDRSLALFGVEAEFPVAEWAPRVAEDVGVRIKLQYEPDISLKVKGLWIDYMKAVWDFNNSEYLNDDGSFDAPRFLEVERAKRKAFERHNTVRKTLIDAYMDHIESGEKVIPSDEEAAEWASQEIQRHKTLEEAHRIQKEGS
jgi:hypothetical protein